MLELGLNASNEANKKQTNLTFDYHQMNRLSKTSMIYMCVFQTADLYVLHLNKSEKTLEKIDIL